MFLYNTHGYRTKFVYSSQVFEPERFINEGTTHISVWFVPNYCQDGSADIPLGTLWVGGDTPYRWEPGTVQV